MDRDDIIRMAREAGGSTDDPSDLLTIANLERFADLVAAAEREACARMCEAYIAEGIGREMAAAIRARDN